MPLRKKKAVKHTRKEKAHLRAVQRRSGPSAVRRRERRLHLQPKPLEKIEQDLSTLAGQKVEE